VIAALEEWALRRGAHVPSEIKSGLGSPAVQLSNCPRRRDVTFVWWSVWAFFLSVPAVVYDRIKITLNNTQCQNGPMANGQSTRLGLASAGLNGNTHIPRPDQTHDPRRIPSQTGPDQTRPTEPSPFQLSPSNMIPSHYNPYNVAISSANGRRR